MASKKGKRNKRIMNMQAKPTKVKATSTSGESSNTTYYVHGPTGIHAQKANGEWQWMIQDALGSVRGVTDNNVNIQETLGYSPDGQPIHATGTPQTEFGFTGEITDPNGLVYLRERYYNPSTGTFISQDPVDGSINNPMSLNRYSYVQGNPINLTDPSGLGPNVGMQGMTYASSVRASFTPPTDPIALLNWVNAMNSGCYVAQAPTTQIRPQVHVTCTLTSSVTARSNPSFYGSPVAVFPPGTVFDNFEERADSPTTGLPPSTWVRVTEYGAYNGFTLWIRRSDGTSLLLQDGPPTCPPFPLNLGTPIPTTPFPQILNAPGCIRGGSCLTGQESAEYQVAFVLACESGASGFYDFATRQQAIADIAHLVRARMQAGSFPNTALGVISQPSQFQCYTEGAPGNIDFEIDQARLAAEALVLNQPLPPPSFPEIHSALFFYGIRWQGSAGAAANTISRSDMLAFLVSQGIVGVQDSTLNGIYLGHGPVNTPPGSNAGFTTLFFTDDPRFTGVIP